MRLLFLFFLVMAFARPVFNSNGNNEVSEKTVAVYLDNSLSMQNQVSGGRAMEVGLAYLTSLADISPSATKFRFTDNAFKYQDQAILTKEKFKDRLTEESYTYSGRELKNIWNRQLTAGTETDFQTPKTVYWLSDFQKSTAGNLSSFVPDSSVKLKIIPIQNPDIANVYVDSVWMTSPFIKQGEINYFKVKLTNTGKKAVADLSVKCLVDGKPSGNSSVDIVSEGSSELEFGFNASPTGEIRIQISFEEQPVSFDNDFYAVIHPVAKINIAIISALNQSFVSKVYGGEEAFTSKSYSIKDLDYSFIQKSNLVVIEEFEKLDENLVKFLQGYVSGGGNLVLIPGESNSTKLISNAKAFGLSSLNLVNTESKGNLAVPDKKQPFFAGIFEEIKTDMTMPEVNNTIKWTGMDEDILVGKTNVPFLSSKKFQKGTVYVLGSPLDNKFTNLASHSLFVPLMYKLAIKSQNNQENLAYRIGQSNIQLKVSDANPNALFTLSNGTISLIPEQKINGDILTISLPKENIVPGFYTLTGLGLNAFSIALNPDIKESNMSTYSPEELKNIFGKYPTIEILPLGNSDSVMSLSGASFDTNEIWKICIILALIFLLGEILLIRFFK